MKFVKDSQARWIGSISSAEVDLSPEGSCRFCAVILIPTPEREKQDLLLVKQV